MVGACLGDRRAGRRPGGDEPLLSDRLFHLRRYAKTPDSRAYDADVVLLSHLHHDHCHIPSLRGFPADVPIVVPRGGERYLARLGPRSVVPPYPGDDLDLGGVRIAVLPATHDGRRHSWSRGASPPALGFRVVGGAARSGSRATASCATT